MWPDIETIFQTPVVPIQNLKTLSKEGDRFRLQKPV